MTTQAYSPDPRQEAEAISQAAAEEVYIFPASFAQQRVWFLCQLAPGSAFYDVPTSLRLMGRLDPAALERSLKEIVRRHEALRTTFSAVEGQAVQVISPSSTLTMPMVDLAEFPAGEREAQAHRLIMEELWHPFDLAHGPLISATLIRLDEEKHVLLLLMHHLVIDIWSSGVFMRELVLLYNAFSAGQPSPLPELTLQYADFTLWQRAWLQGQVMETQLAYWKRQLAGFPDSLALPTDHPRPAVQTFMRGARYTRMLPQGLTEALNALSEREGVTLFMTLLAAFQTMLQQYTGQDDIIVGCPVANRNRAEFEDLIGFFVNMLAFRTDLSGQPTFLELLGRVRQVCLEAYAHQDMPFEKLVEELQPKRNLSRNPLVQVIFALQRFPVPDVKFRDLDMNWFELELKGVRFDLEWHVYTVAEGLRNLIVYNPDLFETATIAQMAAHFHTLLENIVADPDRRLAELSFMTEAERRQWLAKRPPPPPAPHEPGVAAEAAIAPRDDLELRLAQIWQDLLKVEQVGVNQNFFELGGHSLLAMRLLARIERELGQTLPVVTIFQHGTIEQLAGVLRQRQRQAL